MVNLPPRHGKQIADHYPVFTTKGWKTHGTLSVGDQVYAPDGKPVNVVAVGDPLPCDMEVELANGAVIPTHSNHEWHVYDRGSRRWVTVETRYFTAINQKGNKRPLIRREGEKQRSIYMLPISAGFELPARELALDPYCLGVWLGHGQKIKPQFEHAEFDEALVEAFEIVGHQRTYRYTHATTGVISSRFVSLTEPLRNINVWDNKHIPDDYKLSSLDQRRQLLAGLIDSDGHVEAHSGRVRFVNVNTRLIEDVYEIAASLGYRPYVMHQDPALSSSGIQGRQDVYTVGFQPTELLPTRLSRKQINRIAPQRRVGIVDVRSIENGPMGRCIQVDHPDGLYVIGREMTVTHNSRLISEVFPVWYLLHNPTHRVVFVSYSINLARRFGRICRDFFREVGPILDMDIDQDVYGSTEWQIADYGGGMVSVGVGGSLTGRGADCLPAGTLIDTEKGQIPIEQLTASANPPRVFGYNHLTGQIELRKIVASRKVYTDELTEVRTSCGRSLQSTGDHRIYTCESGYREASLLRRSQRLLTREVTQEQDMCPVWCREGWSWSDVPCMLQQKQISHRDAAMCILPSSISEEDVRVRESIAAWSQGCVLQCELLPITSCSKECASVRSMPRTCCEQEQQVLLKGVQGCFEASTDQNMPQLRGSISFEVKSDAVLLTRMCEYNTLHSYAWRWQPPLQEGNQLCQMVHGDATTDSQSRQSSVCGMSGTGASSGYFVEGAVDYAVEPRDSSYRRGCSQQYATEPDNAVQSVPHKASQVGSDIVDMVQRIHTGRIPVYDIQVEGTRNFFANGILVHNCIIIDDPIKGHEEAMSENTRETIEDFYQSTLYSRLEPGGRIVLIQTRWHFDDLSGRLLKHMDEEDGDDWELIKLPAIAVQDEDWEGYHFRAKGEALWPERYPAQKLRDIQTVQKAFWFSALYQQDPLPEEGTLFKRDWFPIIEHQPNDLKPLVRYWDLAASDGKDSDYTSGTLYGYSQSRKQWVVADVVRERSTPAVVERVIRQTAMRDGKRVPVWIEQEPGSSGKSLIYHYQTNVLHGFQCRGHRPTGNKEIRAMPLSALAESGLLVLVAGGWNRDWLQEIDVFPLGAHDDQVDSMSGAHDVATNMINYDTHIKPFGISQESKWRLEL